LGGIDGRKVLVTLGQGSVFGEIALLGVGGMNRRTADVVSRGFSNLFVLQKDDLETVLKDYADAKRILNARARKLMKENEERVVREVSEQKQQQRQEREAALLSRTRTVDVST
jgi:cyclic nucleotide gated channel beta 1